MYVIEGEQNDTSTMVDAAVFDIASRKLLFRAPGLSHVDGSATPVNLSEQLRRDSSEGLRLASDDLVVKLRAELARFQERVEAAPEEYVIEHEPGYAGGASTGAAFALIALALGALASLCSHSAAGRAPRA
jgi:rhombotail lipoprotein